MRVRTLLFLIFAVALSIRLIFFPNNVYFGYDQARDSFASLEILNGKLKIIGPPSSANDNLFHSPLIYYIYAPIYFLSNHNPESVSFIFRILNCLGLILVFKIGSILFDKKVGLLAAFLFAISFEQSQYSLFLSHPALAVLTVLLYYFGLAKFLFKKDPKGLLMSLLGLGLSIQFHYVNLFLLFGLFIQLLYFHNIFKDLKIKWIFYSLLGFTLSISTFIIAELKFHFRETITLTHLHPAFDFSNIKTVILRSVEHNLLSTNPWILVLSLILMTVASKLLLNKSVRPKMFFLIIWFLTGLMPYISGTTSYYHNPGASVSIIIFVSYLLGWVIKRNIFIGLLLVGLIVFSNLNLIYSQNLRGPNKDFVIQPGMLTIDEKRVLDFCYKKAMGKDFAVNALTIPLYVNTTWSYLFEWYGLQKYRYLPVWGGKTASGYAGNLKVVEKRSDLPEDQCLVIEPTVGLSDAEKSNFLREEGYFTQVLEEKNFGTITVQYRKKI